MSKWNIVKLGDVCSKGSSNIAQKDIENNNGLYGIYGAGGYIKNIDFYHQNKPYIAVIKDGAGIGRTMLLPEKTSVIGTMQYLIPNELVIAEYLYYAVTHMNLAKYFTGTTIPHIYFKDYQREKLILPPIEIQQKMVLNLNKVIYTINLCNQILDRLDLIVKARFVEMFGDPVSNPMRWQTKPLLSIGKCKNGMNFHYDDNGVEINCLGVGDFKDLSIITDTSVLPKISLNEMPTNEYFLKNGDIVFVRSNGNKSLVGRSLVVYPDDIPTTFSGFCIRFR
ncbi:MAG: restriction endonuclease subunit S, partial [Ruminococcus sp.]|nr:restriction endonuclease subunit S [Ruminococcus sp.]